MNKIILTGSEGYIGTNLKGFLDENNLLCIDKKIGKDLNNRKLLEEIIDFEPTHIIHLAAVSGIQECENDKEQSLKDNIISSSVLVNLAAMLQIPLIFTSSIAAEFPYSSFYAQGKYQIEQLMKFYKHKMFILRLSNVFGGLNFDKKNTVISSFIKSEKLIINGDGEQKRDFIHVNEVCRYILEILNSPWIKTNNEIVEIGTGFQISINELATKFNKEKLYIYDNNTGIICPKNIEIENMNIYFQFKPENFLDSYIKNIIN